MAIRFNSSCHFCKNRKIKVAVCPKNVEHRLCVACMAKRFDINFDVFKKELKEYWITGCPICDGQCRCSRCKKRSTGEKKTVIAKKKASKNKKVITKKSASKNKKVSKKKVSKKKVSKKKVSKKKVSTKRGTDDGENKYLDILHNFTIEKLLQNRYSTELLWNYICGQNRF